MVNDKLVTDDSGLTWLGSKPHGLWEQYHRDGKLSFRGVFVNGVPKGLWIGYYSDGKLNYKKYYMI